ncbi:MAG TPA: BatD family protein, partial [Candidatus Babeliales bacterium]|nr:BatD family protein [Candidatus Babeliales bacterium]
MDKIVGNIVIGFLSLVTICLDARIVMELRTENGAQNQVVVGQPFTLDVIIEDLYGSVQAPTIKGLNGFAARQSGTYMSSINGKSTARYSYQVRIDTVGSYVLGPAVLQHQQQEFVSNELRVDVVKDVTVV